MSSHALSADEWRTLAAEAGEKAVRDPRNGAFHTESARQFERAAVEREAAA